MKTDKITFRLGKELLNEIDSYVDFEKFKNRTEVIYYLINQSLDTERVAVIMDKGDDITNKDLDEQIKIKGTREYRIAAKLNDSYLIIEQLKRLQEYNFKKVFIVTTKKAIERIKEILADYKSKIDIEYVEIKSLKTMDNLLLLRNSIKKKFLLIYGDIFFDFDIDEFYNSSNKLEKDSINILIHTLSRPEIKGNVWMEGNRIIKHDEKPKGDRTFLVSAGIYILSPNIFIHNGSLPYDTIPKFTKEKKLFGFTTSGTIIHIHNKKNKEEVIDYLNS